MTSVTIFSPYRVKGKINRNCAPKYLDLPPSPIALVVQVPKTVEILKKVCILFTQVSLRPEVQA